MKFYVNLISLLLMVITILIPAQELENTSKKIIAVRSNEKIIIDGVLSESIWKRQGFSELLQFDLNQGKLPSLKTENRVAYDDKLELAKFYKKEGIIVLNQKSQKSFTMTLLNKCDIGKPPRKIET